MGLSVRTARVQLCGPLRVELGGGRVEPALPGRQGRLLFAYLLLERQRWVSREELTALLWPERPPASAALTLRSLLSKLRAALGSESVCGTGGMRIDLGPAAWIDFEAAVSAVTRADRAIESREWREAWSAAQVGLSIASRRFLPGDEGEWIEDRRRELEDLRVTALENLAKAALELGGSELLTAERCARAVVEAAPYRESGYALMMRTLGARGNPAEAVRVYDEAKRRLLDELGIPPAAELRALHERFLGLLGGAARSDVYIPPPRSAAALPPLLEGSERTPLIGRAEALERLIARFDDAAVSGPVAVRLTGEAGIGKTRLIRELVHIVPDRAAVVLYGACPREPSPYQPFLDALRPFMRHVPPHSLDRLRLIDPPLMARLLPELHEEVESPAPEPTTDEHSGRLRALAGLTRVFEEIAREAPVLLALDDMHWADPASAQLLAYLLRNVDSVRLFAIVSYRPRESLPRLTDALGQARQRVPVDVIELQSLTEQDVDTLITAWAGTGAPASFARGLHERSDGNPLFITHLLRHLVRAGAIDPDLRRWGTGRDILALGVPREVSDLIALRLTAFEIRQRQVLNTAAVVGPEFSLEVVERALGETGEQTLDALDAALTAGLIVESTAPAGRFRFAHALIREAIYSQLSRARRGRLHRSVAEAIEQLHGGDLAPHRAELAHHFVAAARAGEDSMPAIRASLAAADFARSLFANEQAEAHYKTALQLLQQRTDPELRMNAAEGLGDMLAVRTAYSEAIDAYLDGLAAIPADHELTRARLERKIGKTHMRAHASAPADEAFDRAVSHLQLARGADGTVAETIELGLDRLTLLYWTNETARMDHLIDFLRPIVDGNGTPTQRVRLIHSSLAREIRRQHYRLTPDSVELAREALAAAEATDDPAMRASARFQLGFSLLLAGEPDQAQIHLQQTADLSTQTGDLMLRARALTYVSLAARRQRLPAAAGHAARKALDAATAANTPEYVAIARANLAWVASQSGEANAARQHAQSALRYFNDVSSRPDFWMPLALWPLLAAAVADQDLTTATRYAKQLLHLDGTPTANPAGRELRAAIDSKRQDPESSTRHLLEALQLGV